MKREPDGDPRRPLYILGPEVALRLENGAVHMDAGGVKDRRLFKDLSHIVFLGQPRGTLPLVLALGRAGIPVYLCDSMGRLETLCAPRPPDPRIWLAQARFGEMEDGRRSFIREIVGAKLRAYAAAARRLLENGRAGEELRKLEQEVWNKTEIASIRGVEGRAGAVWFGALQEALPEEWGFIGRKRHPPPDPVNAMLSLGYTVLYHHAATALLAAGLHPGVGIYHEQREGLGWYPLAADLQEEVRHLADRVMLTLIRKSQIVRSQFEMTEDGRCFMDHASRRTVIEEMKKRLEVTFTPEEGVTLTWREGIARQAEQVRDLVTGRREHYVPLESPK
jgi:CRISPR-associated endonuclease Cas1